MKPGQPCLIFAGITMNQVELRNGLISGKAPALLANIRLGCKGLQGSTTLAYFHETKLIPKIFL
jgi:hypothetical protein